MTMLVRRSFARRSPDDAIDSKDLFSCFRRANQYLHFDSHWLQYSQLIHIIHRSGVHIYINIEVSGTETNPYKSVPRTIVNNF